MATLADVPFALAPIFSHLKDFKEILTASAVNKVSWRAFIATQSACNLTSACWQRVGDTTPSSSAVDLVRSDGNNDGKQIISREVLTLL